MATAHLSMSLRCGCAHVRTPLPMGALLTAQEPPDVSSQYSVHVPSNIGHFSQWFCYHKLYKTSESGQPSPSNRLSQHNLRACVYLSYLAAARSKSSRGSPSPSKPRTQEEHPMVTRLKKPGYCECCAVRYRDLQMVRVWVWVCECECVAYLLHTCVHVSDVDVCVGCVCVPFVTVCYPPST